MTATKATRTRKPRTTAADKRAREAQDAADLAAALAEPETPEVDTPDMTPEQLKSSIKAQNAAMWTPEDVADVMGVAAKTVTRWADDGKLPVVRTVGGHRRFRQNDVIAFLRTNGYTV